MPSVFSPFFVRLAVEMREPLLPCFAPLSFSATLATLRLFLLSPPPLALRLCVRAATIRHPPGLALHLTRPKALSDGKRAGSVVPLPLLGSLAFSPANRSALHQRPYPSLHRSLSVSRPAGFEQQGTQRVEDKRRSTFGAVSVSLSHSLSHSPRSSTRPPSLFQRLVLPSLLPPRGPCSGPCRRATCPWPGLGRRP